MTGWITWKKGKLRWNKLTKSLWYTRVKTGVILCYNPAAGRKAQDTRKNKLICLEEYIKQEQAKETQEKRKQDKQTIHDRIIKKLHDSYMSKYFDAKKDFIKKETVIEKEDLLEGTWVLTGNAKLTEEEFIFAYKQEAAIEGSFRTIKDVVEVRPIYHYNTNRVRSHVFVCVLSYLVGRILEIKSGQTLKMLREKYMTSVIIEGDTRTSPQQIVGGSIPLKTN